MVESKHGAKKEMASDRVVVVATAVAAVTINIVRKKEEKLNKKEL